ncbi:DNA-formamidopyrimidine glycosylase [Fibrisoma limi BUZ 3]|uniref:DNA-formamidopyrimidine glycosylase n=1 Tax=Fibrisoma limi BUZ 3 TaxID=1185876 RepID=I2GQT5_9BACT|nr:DNA-formamidopyrimidine glycosylase family protein [Fibrisoma limi]CCH56263.1 DNA-formamidopyrimidine glycosylase [Fibrisoma limi BUZ 3]
MPELPEVEIRRQYLETSSLHQTIEHVEVEDKKLLTTDYQTLIEKLIGRQFVGTRRVGKNLFVVTDVPNVIVHMHFGMTGDLEYYHASVDRPRFARIVFAFSNGFNLGFLCPRKFERIGLVDDINAYLERKKIGDDGLAISVEQFAEAVRRKKSLIKPVLLDQSTVAGLGNWIVDEVLFQAYVHPEQRANTLTDAQIHQLHSSIQLVLQTAIRYEATYRDFPVDFLIHVREWDDSPYDDVEAHKFCPRCRTRIERKDVGGRTTFYCPNEQVIPEGT